VGVQRVYKLTTEDGRQIRTTGNHPYLVKKEKLSINQSDSSFPQNCQLTPYTSAGFNNTKKGQNNLNNFFFSHLSNQDNNNTGASADVETENVTKTAIKTQQNSFVFNGKIKDGVVITAGKSGFSDSQNINVVFTQTQNNIGVNALVTEEFKHNNLSRPDFQNFFFSQNPGGVAEGNFGILNRNARVLSWNVVKAVTPLKKVENISDSNSRPIDAGFTKSDPLFDNNAGGSGSFDNVIHNGDYNNSVRSLSNSQWPVLPTLSEIEGSEVEGSALE